MFPVTLRPDFLNETATAFPTVGGPFMTTHWSVVDGFSLENTTPDRAEAALALLCRDYWPPLYRFVRLRGYSRDDARDLTQGFFAYMLETKVYSAPDRNKGRLKHALLHILKRYLSAQHSYQCRQKRGGSEIMVSLDSFQFHLQEATEPLSTPAPPDEERCFEWNWAAALVVVPSRGSAPNTRSGAKARVFAELRPFLTGGVGLPTQIETANRLGISEETFRSHLCRMRARYRALLRAEVLRTVSRKRTIRRRTSSSLPCVDRAVT